jgi:hypothetical protein
MTSNLGCVGLGVDDVAGLADLLAELIPTSTATRQEDGSALYVWRDDTGAMLTITTDRAGAIDDVTPSYDGERGLVLGGLTPLHDRVVAADVLEDGDVVTRMAVEVLPPGSVPASGAATLTAFGLDVTLHASPEEYERSDASLLSPGTADDATDDATGDEVPARMASESFLSFALFGDAEEADPLARLAGVVVATRTGTVAATGQTFHAVRVRSLGMEVDVCLAADDHPAPPEPGGVVAGTVYLVADVERPARRRRWFSR